MEEYGKRKKNGGEQRSLLAALFVLLIAVMLIFFVINRFGKKTVTEEEPGMAEATETPREEEVSASTEAALPGETDTRREEAILAADRLAASYDYEGAKALLQAVDGYEGDPELQEKVKGYEETAATCQPANMEEVTHVFYHTLVVDPKRAFANQDKNPQAVGNNQWMTTISEFEKITQEMYDRGYVIVSIHDLVRETTDENGKTVYEQGEILLPPGKKPYVLSQDDVCYYHSYDNYGYAAKMILDENQKPVCEYIQEDGTVQTGAYDLVPLLDAFLEEHPDASYRGAKGIIALTGYNGILGYRTDESYRNVTSDLNHDKKKWLADHPDFDLERERAEAKQVADAMKADGWEFASHTWGHMKVGESSLERLMTDTRKWRENVEPLVGEVDTIIFAHGQDLGDWGAYDESNPKYRYLREQGYSIFCNVDSNQYRTWYGTDYLRQGRRNLDGYRIYNNAVGLQDSVSDLFDAAEIMDPERPPVPALK